MYLSVYLQRFVCERKLETEQNCNILTPTLMAISVVSFSFSWCSSGGPGAHLSAECWLSLPHLVTNGSPNIRGVPRAPSPGWWLSLPHLVSNSSDLQLNQGSQRPLLPGGVFLYHILSLTHLVSNSLGSQDHFYRMVAFSTTSCLTSNSLTSCLHRVMK